ncbi:NAD-dependent deacylase [Salidesulfovibrio onnuriiensis]|uniref:NAD-dependent deacylase n=1 Tax=Salidesulfovibrio onnuriiensis TaxID=2583823 RepID=UPI0011C72F07|nr:NAD-dependent deacylase [Salidesulfovibrio onnuriiensis]
MSNHALANAAELIRDSRRTIAFTGAGISVESGIAPFRGPGGLWTRYDPNKFEMNYFRKHPKESWVLIKRLFYDELGRAKPNPAHLALAELEQLGFLQAVITQNIDGLHQKAGSAAVYEYHGTTSTMQCMQCRGHFPSRDVDLEELPPSCPACGGVLKPDIVFFSEPIPEEVHRQATREARECDVCLVVGTTGEVMPACRIPHVAKNSGAVVIEINIDESAYTYRTSDYFLQGKAGIMLPELAERVAGVR